jgi:arylsulfatase A-like enzyme
MKTDVKLVDKRKRKNVIFIVVDTLRYDYLGCNGFKPSPSPTMDHLISNGLSANNMFSVGCPTQMSMPGIFTSTYPLDKGGYDDYNNRDDFMGEVFKKAGYTTYISWVSVFADPTTSLFRGFDQIYKGGSLDNVVTALNTNLHRLLPLYNTGKKSIDECIETLEPFYSYTLKTIKNICTEKLKEDKKDINLKSIITDDSEWNYSEIYACACKEEERYLADTKAYLTEYINVQALAIQPSTFNRVVHKLTNKLFGKTARKKEKKEKDIFDLILSKKSIVLEKHKSRFDKITQKLKWEDNNISFPQLNFKESSATLHINNLLEWIDENERKEFFAYVHINDTHPPCDFISYDCNNLDVNEEWGCLKELFDKLQIKEKQNMENHLRYVFSVKYVDNQITRLIEYLTARNLMDNTLIVLTSDHGTHFPGLPYRAKAHEPESFYDEFYHIPITFFNKDIKPKKLTGLYSSIDIAPTLFDLLGLSSPFSFKGMSLNKKGFDGREFVLMENLGPGYCDFEIKPITVCIRSKTHKIVFEMPPIKEKKIGFVKELFDLANDPCEKINLVNNAKSLDAVQDLIKIAEERIKEIHQQIPKKWEF